MRKLKPLYNRLRAAGIPLRKANVPGYCQIDIPRWLTRIDYDRKSIARQAKTGGRYQRWRRMHGWFVRYQVRQRPSLRSRDERMLRPRFDVARDEPGCEQD